MALALRWGFLAVAILSGLWLCVLGVYTYRRWEEPGAGAFAAVAVIFGLGIISGASVALSQGAPVPESTVPLWADLGLLGWTVSMIPWFLFALKYTGRHLDFRWRTVLALSTPVLGIFVLIAARTVGLVGVNVVTNLFSTFSLLYMFALVAVGSYLLLRTTYEYGHLSLSQGVSLTIAGIAPLILLNSISATIGELGAAPIFGVYASAFVLPAIGFSLALFRYRMFESTPAIGALGERAIPRETDDLVFVVDRDDRIIKLNETAAETLGCSPTGPLGDPFESLTETSVAAVAEAETIELETTAGTRRFDPQVTSFTDQYDRRLGSLLSLRDVTQRELRKQRLGVLNRVLRHNLRNQVDVIQSNAEAIEVEFDSDYAASIRRSVDEIVALSAAARATDELLSRQPRETDGDLSETVRDVTPSDPETPVTFDLPDTAPLVTDWEALRTALRSAIENAIEHAAASVHVTVETRSDGYLIEIIDDGPGIPEAELASLDAETETQFQHGTGLGLWQLKWSATKLNGDLSFDTTDGTTVRLTIPEMG